MKTDVIATPNHASITAGKIGGMFYALTTYTIGAGALFWLFFAAGGFAPYGFVGQQTDNTLVAIAINTLLVFAFGVQHTIMARRRFKGWLTQYIPAHLERATFVLMSGVFMVLLISFWQPLPGNIWTVEATVSRALIFAVYFTGIVYVLLTSLITNHFELFGLRQAWLNLRGIEYTPLQFKQVWFYKYSRHPMMLGLLLVFWATPDMTLTRLSLAVLLTVYLFAGIRFEEIGLIQEFGDKYREYKKEIGLFFTIRK